MKINLSSRDSTMRGPWEGTRSYGAIKECLLWDQMMLPGFIQPLNH